MGCFNGGSWIEYTGGGEAVYVENCQYSGIENAFITGGGVKLLNGFQLKVSHVRIDNAPTGVDIMSCTETDLRNLTLRNLSGSFGVRVRGVSFAPSYRTVIDNMRADAPDNGNINITWLLVESYAHTVVIDKAALLNGKHAMLMRDSVYASRPPGSPHGDSFSRWVIASDLECDHNHSDAIKLEHGEGVFLTGSWIGSSITGHGIFCASDFRGEVSVGNSRLMGNWLSGIRIVSSGQYTFTGCVIGDNNASNGNNYGIDIDNAGSKTAVTGCIIGDVVGVPGNKQQFGIWLNAGELQHAANIIFGNTTGGIRTP
ncbi:MAG: right-handed parallel beta-helix repeat-containing protein [Thiothrix sp.]